MSILFENDTGSGILFSAEKYINSVMYMECVPKINPNLFYIVLPYSIRSVGRKKKRNTQEQEETKFIDFKKEILHVQTTFSELLPLLRSHGFLKPPTEQHTKNVVALKTAELIYEESGKNLIQNTLGSNFGSATIKTIQNSKFIFPENCQFFCKDINEITTHLLHKQFDLILLDPPWWNKYIRRKRKKSSHAYDMMYNCDLKKIPLETFLNDTGIVVVWCTNSHQHLDFLVNDVSSKWNIHFVAKWYWLKVTVHGEPICEFSKPPGKQPFEQILIGYRNKPETNLPPDGKLLVSVPSAIHSHKPPLVEVLKPFLPENPKCLELFARYLLPNWTSYGNEVLRFQNESLYTFKEL